MRRQLQTDWRTKSSKRFTRNNSLSQNIRSITISWPLKQRFTWSRRSRYPSTSNSLITCICWNTTRTTRFNKSPLSTCRATRTRKKLSSSTRGIKSIATKPTRSSPSDQVSATKRLEICLISTRLQSISLSSIKNMHRMSRLLCRITKRWWIRRKLQRSLRLSGASHACLRRNSRRIRRRTYRSASMKISTWARSKSHIAVSITRSRRFFRSTSTRSTQSSSSTVDSLQHIQLLTFQTSLTLRVSAGSSQKIFSIKMTSRSYGLRPFWALTTWKRAVRQASSGMNSLRSLSESQHSLPKPGHKLARLKTSLSVRRFRSCWMTSLTRIRSESTAISSERCSFRMPASVSSSIATITFSMPPSSTSPTLERRLSISKKSRPWPHSVSSTYLRPCLVSFLQSHSWL